MSLNINDLSSGLLKYTLDFLDDTQLFGVEKNMQKWQKCVFQLEKRRNSNIWMIYQRNLRSSKLELIHFDL